MAESHSNIHVHIALLDIFVTILIGTHCKKPAILDFSPLASNILLVLICLF